MAFGFIHGRHQIARDLNKTAFNGTIENFRLKSDNNAAGAAAVGKDMISNILKFGAVLNLTDGLLLALHNAYGTNNCHYKEYDENYNNKFDKSFHKNYLPVYSIPNWDIFIIPFWYSIVKGGMSYFKAKGITSKAAYLSGIARNST